MITPVRTSRSLQLDFDVDAGRQVELHQRVDRLRRGIDDVEKTLVSPDFELFAALLVYMRGPVDGETLDACGQRNGTAYLCACAFCRVDDFPRRIVEDAVIEGLEPYLIILATTPAPTVRPPSRIAKRSFSSMAIGTISSTSTVTLSPGITISVPSGSFTMPVTSVVRK